MSDIWENPMKTDGFEFVEYTAPDPEQLGRLFEQMGFTAVAKHRSKNVTLYRQGDVNFILNAENTGFPRSFASLHGPSACAIAFRVADAADAYRRAMRRGAFRPVSTTSCRPRPTPATSCPTGARPSTSTSSFCPIRSTRPRRRSWSRSTCPWRMPPSSIFWGSSIREPCAPAPSCTRSEAPEPAPSGTQNRGGSLLTRDRRLRRSWCSSARSKHPTAGFRES